MTPATSESNKYQSQQVVDHPNERLVASVPFFVFPLNLVFAIVDTIHHVTGPDRASTSASRRRTYEIDDPFVDCLIKTETLENYRMTTYLEPDGAS